MTPTGLAVARILTSIMFGAVVGALTAQAERQTHGVPSRARARLRSVLGDWQPREGDR